MASVLNGMHTSPNCDIFLIKLSFPKMFLLNSANSVTRRIHSSRMRTSCSLTIFPGSLPSWGGSDLGGGGGGGGDLGGGDLGQTRHLPPIRPGTYTPIRPCDLSHDAFHVTIPPPMLNRQMPLKT